MASLYPSTQDAALKVVMHYNAMGAWKNGEITCHIIVGKDPRHTVYEELGET